MLLGDLCHYTLLFVAADDLWHFTLHEPGSIADQAPALEVEQELRIDLGAP